MAGVHITLATGRQYVYIAPLVAELALHSPQITSSGAVITLPASGEMLYADRIAREVAAEAIRLGEQLGITLVIVQNGKTFTRAINADIEHMLTYGDPRPHVAPDLAATLDLPPTNIKAIAYRQDELYARAEAEFQRALGSAAQYLPIGALLPGVLDQERVEGNGVAPSGRTARHCAGARSSPSVTAATTLPCSKPRASRSPWTTPATRSNDTRTAHHGDIADADGVAPRPSRRFVHVRSK